MTASQHGAGLRFTEGGGGATAGAADADVAVEDDVDEDCGWEGCSINGPKQGTVWQEALKWLLEE